MKIKQLEVFAAIAETGSFSRGAEASFITQSTASQHIADLESLAGVRLLDRTGRGAVPTEAGKVLLEQARQVISALRQAEDALFRFRTKEAAELRIAASTVPGTYLVPDAVAALRTVSPGITVTVEIGDSSRALALLGSGTVEIALTGTVADDPLYESEVVARDTVCLVAQPGHPWAARGKIRGSDLLSEPLVMRKSGSGTGKAVQDALQGAGLDVGAVQVGAYFTSSEAVRQAVLAGCGPTFISEAAVGGELARGELVAVEIEGMRIDRSFVLVWRRGRSLSPAAEAFREVVREKRPEAVQRTADAAAPLRPAAK